MEKTGRQGDRERGRKGKSGRAADEAINRDAVALSSAVRG
jgi:hypothetical protein